MTHTGDGILGKVSGKVVRSRIIADCGVKNQVVVEEWLVREGLRSVATALSVDGKLQIRCQLQMTQTGTSHAKVGAMMLVMLYSRSRHVRPGRTDS